MSFRVKLRIKSVNPCYPAKNAPLAGRMPTLKTDPALLKAIYEAAKTMPPLSERPWERRFDHGNLPYRGPGNSFLWNGIDPLNRSAAQ